MPTTTDAQVMGADYGSKQSSYFEDARPEMESFVPADAARVLEVGCGTAAFAALLKSRRRVVVTVIEPFPAAAEVAARRVDEVICQPIEQAVASLDGRQFDCVVLNDVLEHLADPWAVLRELRTVLAPGGCFVASIPNVRYFPVFKDYLVGGDWRYQHTGVLDRTHLRLFSRTSLPRLFEGSGLSLRRIEGINATPLPWKFALFNRLLGNRFADTRFKQYACVAVAAASTPTA
jgi:2-polyprenyl-3-methyl-5-hydroxy-6-metoxy-1,4-benzoquinol methylase